MPIMAGRFDPTPAFVYKPLIELVNNEPIERTPELYGRFFIRFPFLARTGSEREVAEQRISYGQIAIRIRKTPRSMNLTPSWWFVHKSQTYHIVKSNPIADRDELEFLCENREDGTFDTV